MKKIEKILDFIIGVYCVFCITIVSLFGFHSCTYRVFGYETYIGTYEECYENERDGQGHISDKEGEDEGKDKSSGMGIIDCENNGGKDRNPEEDNASEIYGEYIHEHDPVYTSSEKEVMLDVCILSMSIFGILLAAKKVTENDY